MTKLIIFQTKLEIKIKTLTNTKLSVYHLSLVIQFAREITLADNLVIVESPAKAKTIEKYLGKRYKVIASMGHVRDLPRSQMGVDTEDNYEPKYITIRGKGPVVKDLKKHAKKAKKFFLQVTLTVKVKRLPGIYQKS